MESWSYISGRKGSVANETSSTSDSSVRSKNPLMGWEIKSPYSSTFLPMENHGFGELGIHDLFKKQLPSDPVRDVLSSKLIPPTPNAFSGEDDTTSKLSSTAVDSPLIDLKLGRFGDQPKFSQGAGLILSSSESSMPPKRARLLGMSSHTAYCQVYGCNKDLSSSKDYHKRHKVCEVHSKTAKVIVNGIEQRFCQQCSRFHLLAEFDDGKRSCRKRLAGHNERRRKPQVGIHSGRTGKPLQSYDASIGTVFQGTTLTPSSFVCQDILPHGMFHPEKTGGNDWCKRIKVEEATDYSPLSAIPITNTWNSHSNSFFPNNGEKLVPSLHDPFFHDTSLPTTDFSVFYSGLSGISDSGCALSLLSSKSQNSSKIPMGRPLVIPPAGTSNSHHGTSQVSDKFGDVGPVSISESFSIGNGNYGGSDFGSAKGGGISSEDGATIDLLQLSSQLQRVEHQRQSMQGEHENDAFCCLRIT